ncbi:hypothetical protein BKA69DRAFT_401915 [Paraphysoderma sedebokerense]|nr:hypothetical protein BKA69DRAFT_401915 [Paraphysoderma sedebokerense]
MSQGLDHRSSNQAPVRDQSSSRHSTFPSVFDTPSPILHENDAVNLLFPQQSYDSTQIKHNRDVTIPASTESIENSSTPDERSFSYHFADSENSCIHENDSVNILQNDSGSYPSLELFKSPDMMYLQFIDKYSAPEPRNSTSLEVSAMFSRPLQRRGTNLDLQAPRKTSHIVVKKVTVPRKGRIKRRWGWNIGLLSVGFGVWVCLKALKAR